MSMEYDADIAKHYAAYRPSLHDLILSKCLLEGSNFDFGLDVGCGTGYSSIALANYCNHVIGIDPSSEMVDKAIPDSNIKYVEGFLIDSKLKEASFDIITFAGSLFYAKSQELFNEVFRLGKHGSKIIVYDFEVLIKPVFELLDLSNNDENKSEYDHAINFSGLQNNHLKVVTLTKEKTSLNVQLSDLAHLVLSEKFIYNKLNRKWSTDNLFTKVHKALREKSNKENFALEAYIYYTVYEK